jgi:hypothetical protein
VRLTQKLNLQITPVEQDVPAYQPG